MSAAAPTRGLWRKDVACKLRSALAHSTPSSPLKAGSPQALVRPRSAAAAAGLQPPAPLGLSTTVQFSLSPQQARLLAGDELLQRGDRSHSAATDLADVVEPAIPATALDNLLAADTASQASLLCA